MLEILDEIATEIASMRGDLHDVRDAYQRLATAHGAALMHLRAVVAWLEHMPDAGGALPDTTPLVHARAWLDEHPHE